MQSAHLEIWPCVTALLVVALVYRRVRRNFGRQPLQPARMRLRIGTLLLLGCLLLPATFSSAAFLGAEVSGLLAGAALGVWGARATRFQTFSGRLHYLPHTHTGVAVSLLLVGRLVYRLGALYMMRPAGTEPSGAMLQGLQAPAIMRSPLTVALLFVVIGYHVCYYGLVLRKAAHITPEDLEVDQTPTTAAP